MIFLGVGLQKGITPKGLQDNSSKRFADFFQTSLRQLLMKINKTLIGIELKISFWLIRIVEKEYQFNNIWTVPQLSSSPNDNFLRTDP